MVLLGVLSKYFLLLCFPFGNRAGCIKARTARGGRGYSMVRENFKVFTLLGICGWLVKLSCDAEHQFVYDKRAGTCHSKIRVFQEHLGPTSYAKNHQM